MGFVCAKLMVAAWFYKLWNTMLAHNHHKLSHIEMMVASLACISATIPASGPVTLFGQNVLKYLSSNNVAQSYSTFNNTPQYLHVSH